MPIAECRLPIERHGGRERRGGLTRRRKDAKDAEKGIADCRLPSADCRVNGTEDGKGEGERRKGRSRIADVIASGALRHVAISLMRLLRPPAQPAGSQ